MKLFYKLFIVWLGLFLPTIALAQELKGRIIAENKQPITGATISLNDVEFQQSNFEGYFKFKNSKFNKLELKISMIGYETKTLLVESSNFLTVELKKTSYTSEQAIVTTTRVDERAAATFTNINAEEIAKRNLGQDLPYLLNQAPSVVVTSYAGTGIGYTGIRIRGSDATRTNISINGIPLNDAESQGTFLVNLPEFASSINNIQLQRGVGTSSNGAGAFGASINIQTDKQEENASAEVNTSFGSYGTERYTAKVNTGLLNNHWTFNGRISKIASNGYINNSSSLLNSIFSSATYADEKNLLKFIIMSGREKTSLAWEGVPFDSLKSNRKYNPIAEVYPDQFDNYQQNHYQVFYTRILNESSSVNIGFHYTRGTGYYQEFKKDQYLQNYGLSNIYIGTDSILSTDLIRRRWLLNDFKGVVFSINKSLSTKLNLIIGAAVNSYDGDHWGEVTWAQYASKSLPTSRFYDGKGIKNEANIYAKLNYQIDSKWSAFIDFQTRFIDYKISGTDVNRIDRTQSHYFNFFNPKAGISFVPNAKNLFYLSYSVANKEPNRDDFISGKANLVMPKSEHLDDFEIGWKRRETNYVFEFNFFNMNYLDQLIPTGKLNDVGESIRENTPKSYRRGLELNATWMLAPKLFLSTNIALSVNKIAQYNEYIYDYDSVSYALIDTVQNTYRNTDIAFSPSTIIGGSLTYEVFTDFKLTLDSKWVGKQYLDNTSNANKQIDAFFVNDLLISYHIKVKKSASIDFNIKVNNILNELYVSDGYTYSYLTNGSNTTARYYYPQAERNFLVGCNLKF